MVIVYISLLFLTFLVIASFVFIRNKQNLIFKLQLQSVDRIKNDTLIFQFYSGVPIKLSDWSLEVGSFFCLFEEINLYSNPIIVEIGSGNSSILISNYLCHFKNTGKLYSIEHNAKFLNIISSKIQINHNANYWEGIHIDLEESVYLENKILSYVEDELIYHLKNIKPDILIIDGPPVSLVVGGQPNIYCRSKISKVLSKLDKKPVIFIDDANRIGEQVLFKELIKLGYKRQETYTESEKGFIKLK